MTDRTATTYTWGGLPVVMRYQVTITRLCDVAEKGIMASVWSGWYDDAPVVSGEIPSNDPQGWTDEIPADICDEIRRAIADEGGPWYGAGTTQDGRYRWVVVGEVS